MSAREGLASPDSPATAHPATSPPACRVCGAPLPPAEPGTLAGTFCVKCQPGRKSVPKRAKKQAVQEERERIRQRLRDPVIRAQREAGHLAIALQPGRTARQAALSCGLNPPEPELQALEALAEDRWGALKGAPPDAVRALGREAIAHLLFEILNRRFELRAEALGHTAANIAKLLAELDQAPSDSRSNFTISFTAPLTPEEAAAKRALSEPQ